MSEFLSFPDPVNNTSARVVAAGVVTMAAANLALDEPVLLAPLAYGFLARVLCGPRFSPLGLVATRVITPRLAVKHSYSPGPPKRLAQGMGLAMSTTALVLRLLGRRRASQAMLAALLVAASLEALFGLCLACKMYPLLVRIGIVSPTACPECTDLATRLPHVHLHRHEAA